MMATRFKIYTCAEKHVQSKWFLVSKGQMFEPSAKEVSSLLRPSAPQLNDKLQNYTTSYCSQKIKINNLSLTNNNSKIFAVF